MPLYVVVGAVVEVRAQATVVVLAVVAEFFSQAIYVGQIGTFVLCIGVHFRQQSAILAGEEFVGAPANVAGAHALGTVGHRRFFATEQAGDHDVVPGTGCTGCR
ncbi:hypothetical protein D3C85_1547680 [compost metagenome]